MKKELTYPILILLSGIVILSLLFFSMNALYNPRIPFLKTDSRAKWIMYGLQPDTSLRSGIYWNLSTSFIKTFHFNPNSAQPISIHLMAFRQYHLSVNGREIPPNPFAATSPNWKGQQTYNISNYLIKGLNKIEISVSCMYGPPALWLCSEGLENNISTDDTWLVSIVGSPLSKAHIAIDNYIHPANKQSPTPLGAVIQKWPILLTFFFILLGLNYFIRFRNKKNYHLDSKITLYICIACWTIIFINNINKLPHDMGFDVSGHIENIEYIATFKSIPFGNQGWETHQPPLFYILSAILLSGSKLFHFMNGSYHILKLIPFLSGLGQIVMVFWGARLLFPGNMMRQSIATIFSAIIPMNIYISSYISNESLSAFLISVTLLVTIKWLDSRNLTLKHFVLLGMIIGFAIMTKISGIVLLPVIYFLFLLKLLQNRQNKCSNVLIQMGVMTLIIIIFGGWYYIRNYIELGKTMITPWEGFAPVSWWQDPGFHTAQYFFQFGKVFSNPYFAGFYSLFDSLYSTFWMDSSLGGRTTFGFHPPWNYQYMPIIIIWAAPVIAISVFGLYQQIKKILRSFDRISILMTGSIFMVILSVLQINFKIPYYAHAKAFFALSLIMPISIIFSSGFGLVDTWLQTNRLIWCRSILHSWFLLLSFLIFFSFFIPKDQIQRPMDLSELADQATAEGFIQYYKKQLQTTPNDYFAHSMLINAYMNKKEYDKAIVHCEAALGLFPDDVKTQGMYARLLLIRSSDPVKEDLRKAIKHAGYSCRLTGYLNPELLMVLAAAYAKTDDKANAEATAYRALEIAKSEKKQHLIQLIRDTILYNKI